MISTQLGQKQLFPSSWCRQIVALPHCPMLTDHLKETYVRKNLTRLLRAAFFKPHCVKGFKVWMVSSKSYWDEKSQKFAAVYTTWTIKFLSHGHFSITVNHQIRNQLLVWRANRHSKLTSTIWRPKRRLHKLQRQTSFIALVHTEFSGVCKEISSDISW